MSEAEPTASLFPHRPAGGALRSSKPRRKLMSLRVFRAKVSRVTDLTHDVRELDLDLVSPSEITFTAGQFISFEIWPVGGSRPVTRPYSIASPPRQSRRVTLLFNRVPGGPGSGFLYGLRRGDEVQFKGVAGMFYLRNDPGRDVLFIATGTRPCGHTLLGSALRAGPVLPRRASCAGEGARQLLVRDDPLPAHRGLEAGDGAGHASGGGADLYRERPCGLRLRERAHDHGRHRHPKYQGPLPDLPGKVLRRSGPPRRRLKCRLSAHLNRVGEIGMEPHQRSAVPCVIAPVVQLRAPSSDRRASTVS